MQAFEKILENHLPSSSIKHREMTAELAQDCINHFYFQVFHDTTRVAFCFVVPCVENHIKEFFEIDFSFDFSWIEDALEFDGQTIHLRPHSMNDETAITMMHGHGVERLLLSDNQKQFLDNRSFLMSMPYKHVTLIDYMEQVNKDVIVPYLKQLSFTQDNTTLRVHKGLLQDLIQEHVDFFADFINSVYSGETIHHNISNDDLKVIKDTHHYYKTVKTFDKLNQALPQKTGSKRLKI